MTDLPPLGYSRPGTLPEVLAALRRPGACVYAGGTDLLVALQHRETATNWVRELVDIKDLGEARGIDSNGGVLRVGALVTAKELATSTLVRRVAPALRQAAAATSAPLLRARGTVGGNVVWPHPAPDVATALLALNAVVEVVGTRGGRRRVPLTRFLSSAAPLPGRQLVLAVRVPPTTGSAFEKLAHRHAFARAMVSVALAVHARWVAVAVAGVGTRPVVARFEPDVLSGPRLAATLERELDALRSLDATRRRATIALVRRAAARLS